MFLLNPKFLKTYLKNLKDEDDIHIAVYRLRIRGQVEAASFFEDGCSSISRNVC